MRKSKVFVGPINTANGATSIAKALRTVGIFADSYSFDKDFRNYKADYNNILFGKFETTKFQKVFINRFTKWPINAIIRIILLIFTLFKYDTFIFISPHSIFTKNLDLPILKLFKKKIAFILLGCGDRNPIDEINSGKDGVCRTCKDVILQQGCYCNNLIKKEKIMQNIEYYSDYIFATTDLIGFLKSKDNYHICYVSSAEPVKYKILKKTSKDVITITHFPSRPVLKGTLHVLSAMKNIKKKYGHKINFIHKKLLHKELLEILENDSDILIDQFVGSHGLLAVEAMARGNVVIEQIGNWFKNERPELPVVSCNPNDLEKTIEMLLNNPEKMKIIANESIMYYKKYHSPVSVGNHFKKIMNLK